MPPITFAIQPDGTHTIIGPQGTTWDWDLYATHFPGRAAIAEHRREINPERFNHYHPLLAWLMTSPEPSELPGYPWLPEMNCPPPVPGPIVPGVPIPGVPDVPGGPEVPHVIPEPGSLVLWSVGFLMIWAWSRVRRRGK